MSTRTKKRKAGEEEEEEKRKKSLKIGEADLKVTVGKKKKRVFWHHCRILAACSNYIDTILSTPMKESKSRELTFPDIESEQWERMISYATNPVASRRMKVADALELAPLYDKYEFRGGVELCDSVLEEVFDSDDPELLNQQVEATMLAFQVPGLTETLQRGKWDFESAIGDIPASKLRYTEEHIRKLVPLLANDGKLKEHIKDFTGTADVENPMFPELFVSQFQLIAARNTMQNVINEIDVSGCGEASGTYKKNGDGTIRSSNEYYREAPSERYLNGNQVHSYRIDKRPGENWIIHAWVQSDRPDVDIESRDLLVCKGSQYATLPPRSEGWTKVNKPSGAYVVSREKPNFAYFHRSKEGGRYEIKADLRPNW